MMMSLLRLVAAWGIVFYHSNYPLMSGHTVGWLPFVRDVLFGWSLPFFYALSASNILSYLDSGKSFWTLWKKYAIYLVVLIMLYQAVRVIGMGHSLIPCNDYTCWLTFLKTGNHSIGYYLFDWLVFALIASMVNRMTHKRLRVITLFVALFLVSRIDLFNKPLASLWFSVGIVFFLFQKDRIKENRVLRKMSFWIYLIHPFVYMVTDRLIPRLLPTTSPDIVLGMIIASTIVASTLLSFAYVMKQFGGGPSR